MWYVLYHFNMEQSYCLISSYDLEQIDKMIVRAINLCANPLPYSQVDEHSDSTASYPGAYGYTYQTLKSVKEHIDTARPFDPSLESTPF
jgi:hypothetical protein